MPKKLPKAAKDRAFKLYLTDEFSAKEIADHIYFTDRGIIVEHGPPKTFFTEAKDPRTKEFLSQIL